MKAPQLVIDAVKQFGIALSSPKRHGSEINDFALQIQGPFVISTGGRNLSRDGNGWSGEQKDSSLRRLRSE
jgi:hypothetical protein